MAVDHARGTEAQSCPRYHHDIFALTKDVSRKNSSTGPRDFIALPPPYTHLIMRLFLVFAYDTRRRAAEITV